MGSYRFVVLGLFAIRACYTVLFLAYMLLSLSGSDGPSPGGATDCQRPVGWRLATLVVLAVMTLEYAVLELRQMWTEGFQAWLRHSWTLFDAAQIVLMALVLGLHWSCAVPVFVIRCLAAVLVLVLFWRMLGYMTVVEGLGSFVRQASGGLPPMVQEVTWDLRWFFVFLGFIFAGFVLSILVLAVDLSVSQGSSRGSGGQDSDGSSHPLVVLVFARLYTMMYSNFDADMLLDPDAGSAAAVTNFWAVICSI
ncbi:hypothetical protein GPECTOR_215g442 [Gonium pectorale]|uniref:Ion transport domain-containing protein n=1 Tax=Gonium pectorale TaxID=33097 RepID=A0A150FWR1_GONPE|nr:hypothetical protein GPECTOR_215g442 [Gonium pectorale]|eukprot:KXZ42052.1 hypothetical protein GPECTOR_215g442 [Gonium pectorale]